MEITQLNQKGTALMDKVDHDDSDHIQEQLDDVKKRWNHLQAMTNDRQQHLEESLYHLGQFSVIVEEILIWMKQTTTILVKKKQPPKEKKLIEVEIAKLKVHTVRYCYYD